MTPAWLRRALRSRLVVLGVLLLLPLAICALAAPLIAPYDPLAIDTAQKLLPPSLGHPFGTDEFGRDVFSRVVYGARISLRVGAVATLLTAVFGIALGALAGFYRLVDAFVSRIVDGLMIFPGVILAIMIMAALGPHERNVVLAMTILYTPRVIRVVRASVLELRDADFVDAARVVGCGDLRVLAWHILPNAFGPAMVQVTFGFAWAILVEAGLSFLGLGTPPPAPSWGNIISDGREFVRTAPWLMLFPGIMISLSVMGLNLIGDGARDLLDPRMVRRVEGSVA